MANYRIKDIETLTGIKAHTIRMWEKRYGILQPDRTDTKIRTYSDEDVTRILNVSILNNNGWKISKIAALDDFTLRREVLAASRQPNEDSALVNLLIQSLIYMDEDLFHRVIDNAVEKENFKTVYINYIIPFLKKIGVMWHVGSINPAQEHFISNLIRQKLIVAIDKLPTPVNTSIDYLLFCREQEWHEIGLLFYHYCLKEDGQTIVYLGQNVPLDSIKQSIDILQPRKGLVSSFVAAFSEEEMIDYIQKISSFTQIPLYLGGGQTQQIDFLSLNNVKSVEEIIQ